MKPVLVLYATREGQTRRIAEHIETELREHGFEADALDVSKLPQEFALVGYDSAILAASVHLGRHEREMVAFVSAHRSELERMQAVFLSVSASEAGAENVAASPEARARSAENVRHVVDAFIDETEWRPARVIPIAGALMYRQYNILVRFVMRLIARSEGASTDTSRNTEYTDWEALDRFVEEWTADQDDSATAENPVP